MYSVHVWCIQHIYFNHTAYIEVFAQSQHFQGQGQWSLRPKMHKLPSKSEERMQWEETMERVSLDKNIDTGDYTEKASKWKQKQTQSSSQEPSTLTITQHCNLYISWLGTLLSHTSYSYRYKNSPVSYTHLTLPTNREV